MLGEQSLATHWLPAQGEVSIGSGPDCDLRIEEASVSARHALLRMGAEVTVEAQDAGVPILVQNNPLVPGAMTTLAPGDLLQLGNVKLVLQKRAQARPRRIWTHGYFDSRLEEECIRAERYASQFALLRVRVDPSVPATNVEDVLANVLRNVDIVGAYGPGEHEVLLVDTPPAGAELVRDRLASEFAVKGVSARLGLAHFPLDGQSPDVLTAEAGSRARGDGPITEPLSEDITSPRLEASLPLVQLVERIAASHISVLLLGETGVGKERLAERVHQLSPRANKPFLRLNCAALSESLLESELFGHERGSFTGAHAQKLGLLETAAGGTVFLDEVGEMPLAIQAKLLRVIEERLMRRVGGVKTIEIDVRFVSATNRDLEAEIRRGTFRQDLYFRLNGVSVVIPPLRERTTEIPELCKLFISETCRKMGRSEEPVLAAQAMTLMLSYGWPGNIRELRNVIERAVILCPGQQIGLAQLPVEKMSATFASRRAPASGTANSSAPRPSWGGDAGSADPAFSAAPGPTSAANGDVLEFRKGRQQEVEAYERRRIEEALQACAGNQTEAARRLGISRRTLINRLSRYALPRPRKKASSPSDPTQP
nr:anaerobic nitric oxide reductase transcription regulator NorR [uncultured bacterium]